MLVYYEQLSGLTCVLEVNLRYQNDRMCWTIKPEMPSMLFNNEILVMLWKLINMTSNLIK